MRNITCDCCGETFPEGDGHYEMNYQGCGLPRIDYDFCLKCMKKILQFIKSVPK